jgi:hypothetical protein
MFPDIDKEQLDKRVKHALCMVFIRSFGMALPFASLEDATHFFYHCLSEEVSDEQVEEFLSNLELASMKTEIEC